MLKNIGETDDGAYDWLLVNQGKGLDTASIHSSLQVNPQRASRDPANRGSRNSPAPPSPALVRHGSRRKSPLEAPGALLSGSVPNSAVAHMGVPAPRRQSMQQTPGEYGGTPQMVTNGAAPPVLSDVQYQHQHPDLQHQQQAEEQPSTLWKILTCRCG